LQELLNQEKSIYIQIKEMLERDILKDIILEEEKVPSTNELAKLYAINPATAAKGVNLLVDEGILYKKRGIGMFVAAGAKEAIKKKKENIFLKII
jgi:transcriptional regulator, GntR family